MKVGVPWPGIELAEVPAESQRNMEWVPEKES